MTSVRIFNRSTECLFFSFFFSFYFLSLAQSGPFLILLISLEFRALFLCYLQFTFKPIQWFLSLSYCFFFVSFSSKISPWHHFISFISDFLDFFFMCLKGLQIAVEALLWLLLCNPCQIISTSDSSQCWRLLIVVPLSDGDCPDSWCDEWCFVVSRIFEALYNKALEPV